MLASNVPLPGVTTTVTPKNSATNNRVHRNKLSRQPIDTSAAVAESRALQAQLFAQQQSFVTPGSSAHLKKPPQQAVPGLLGAPIDLSDSPVVQPPTAAVAPYHHAGVYHPFAQAPIPAAPVSSTPEMVKRVRKRAAKELKGQIGKPHDGETAKLMKVQKNLAGKDPSLSLAIEDADVADSQEGLMLALLLTSPGK